MRLDHDFLRALLQKIGELPFDGGFHTVQIEGHSEEKISCHIMLLQEAGLIEGTDVSSHGRSSVQFRCTGGPEGSYPPS